MSPESRMHKLFPSASAASHGATHYARHEATTTNDSIYGLLHDPSVPQALRDAASQLVACVPFATGRHFTIAAINTSSGYDVYSLSDGRPDVPRSFEWITPRNHAALCAAGEALRRFYSVLVAEYAMIDCCSAT
jgi:hypothetical protein